MSTHLGDGRRAERVNIYTQITAGRRNVCVEQRRLNDKVEGTTGSQRRREVGYMKTSVRVRALDTARMLSFLDLKQTSAGREKKKLWHSAAKRVTLTPRSVCYTGFCW